MPNQQQHEWNIESYRSMAETGKAAQTALLTVSGGSSAAILSFVGALSDKAYKPGNAELAVALMLSLSWFALSLLAMILMSGTAYVAQAYYKKASFEWSDAVDEADPKKKKAYTERGNKENKRGDIASFFVAAFFIASVLFLSYGGYKAISAGSAAVMATARH